MRIQNVAPISLNEAVELIKALADPARLRIVNLLGGGEVCVCHLHEALELPQPTVSRHLAYLRKRGLVIARKEGLWVHYRLARPANDLHRRLLDCVDSGLGGEEILKRDRERLASRSCCNIVD